MKKVGLTGNIGSGKTTISKFFKILNIPVFNSDLVSKQILIENQDIKFKIEDIFGSNSYDGKKLNTSYIAQIVFNDKETLKQLNQLIHPLVQQSFEHWSERNKNYPYLIKEAAILFESNSYKKLDKIICVTAPDELRIGRIIKRNGLSRTQVLQRMNNQMNQFKKAKLSDYVIKNDHQCLITTQVLDIHDDLLKNI